MSGNRLQVRLPPIYWQWIGAVGGDESSAARALIALGAAALGLEGAAGEALSQLGGRLDRALAVWLYDRCSTAVRQMPGEVPALEDDPFAIGIEV